MATKITLASGVVLEYEGDVLIGEDGSVLLEGKDTSTIGKTPALASGTALDSHVSVSEEDKPLFCEEDLVLEMLSPKVGLFFELRTIDAMLNITDPHFDTLVALCVSDQFREYPWRSEHIIEALDLTMGRVLSRTSVLVQAGLILRVRRGECRIAPGVAEVFFKYRDEIRLERKRRRSFVRTDATRSETSSD